jgi:hypothetical protein
MFNRRPAAFVLQQRRIHPWFNQEVIRPCLPSDLILDLDSTVETVYGDQEGAAR